VACTNRPTVLLRKGTIFRDDFVGLYLKLPGVLAKRSLSRDDKLDYSKQLAALIFDEATYESPLTAKLIS
jgi:hypothetical protein